MSEVDRRLPSPAAERTDPMAVAAGLVTVTLRTRQGDQPEKMGSR
jgi:hypothetical protein